MPFIAIINGPNLNLLGRREPEIYGCETLDDIVGRLRAEYPGVELRMSCHSGEGDLIDAIHAAGLDAGCRGIILNAGAYTHTSLAVADAVAAIPVPVVEMHLSNVFSREEIRHRSLIAAQCAGSISGFGALGYELALAALLKKNNRSHE